MISPFYLPFEQLPLTYLARVPVIIISDIEMNLIAKGRKTAHTILNDSLKPVDHDLKLDTLVLFSCTDTSRYMLVKIQALHDYQLQQMPEGIARAHGVTRTGPNTWRDYSLPERDPETKQFINNPEINSPELSFATWWNTKYKPDHGWANNPRVVTIIFSTEISNNKGDYALYA